MDFIGFMGTQHPVVNWEAAERVKLLDDLAAHFGWKDSYIDSISKKEFVNTKLIERMKGWVNKARKVRAMETITYDDVDL